MQDNATMQMRAWQAAASYSNTIKGWQKALEGGLACRRLAVVAFCGADVTQPLTLPAAAAGAGAPGSCPVPAPRAGAEQTGGPRQTAQRPAGKAAGGPVHAAATRCLGRKAQGIQKAAEQLSRQVFKPRNPAWQAGSLTCATGPAQQAGSPGICAGAAPPAQLPPGSRLAAGWQQPQTAAAAVALARRNGPAAHAGGAHREGS
jgi:hypothetical protein